MKSLVVALLILSAAAVATLFPVWSAPGWPSNHEHNTFAVFTHVYARHLSWLDVMPIWSSADASGFGSPKPLMYHKLFYMLAGWLTLVTGSLKSAHVVALALLLVGSAVGVVLILRELGAGRLASLIAGCCQITANYTVTNWLVRGAMAEFCGAMVVPWVLLFFVKTIQSGRLRIGLGVALGLLWLSHSVLAFFVGLILALTYLALAALRLAPWSVLNPRTAWPSAAWFVFLVGSYLVPMAILGRDYDVGRFLAVYRPSNQFRPPVAYLWDQRWRFGVSPNGLTVQLDHAMLLLAAIGLGVLAVRKPAARGERWRVLQPALPFLVVLAFALFLQLPASAFFYEWVPGAVYIQFPWRLLAIITPSLIVAAVYLGDKALPGEARHFMLGGASVWMVVACGAFVPMNYPRISLDFQLTNLRMSSAFREYEPRQAQPLAETMARVSARWKEVGCSYSTADPLNDEVPTARFRTVCGQSVVLPLPLWASPAHMVTTSNQPLARPCMQLPEFPGVCSAAIPAADGDVSVKLPSMVSLAGWAWRQLSGG